MKKQILFTLLLLASVWQVWAQTPDRTPLKLRVGIYNVGHFNEGMKGGLQLVGKREYPNNKSIKEGYARKEMLRWRKWIGEQSLDLLVVNEWNKYFDEDSLLHAEDELLKPFYKNIYFGDEHTWIYNGIATNYNLTNMRMKYWAGDYYALIGDLKIGNKVITIMSSHIPWQKEWHSAAMDSLLAEMKKYEYLICMGDMNASDAEQVRIRDAGFNIANGGYQGWFGTAAGNLLLDGRAGGPNTNIDNIYTSKNIKIMNVSAPYTTLNDLDHLPVLADLIITW